MNANPINVVGSGVTISDCGISSWNADKGLTIVSEANLDIGGYDFVTLNAIGGSLEVLSLLSNGDFFIRANNGTPAQVGTIEHTASGGWKIDGKTLNEIVREELCKILNCS